MAYEIDFLAVGEASHSGDAIAIRYERAGSRPKVVIIDGGFAANGDAMVEHVKNHYGTSAVDLVISTHPDVDHISGLFPVLEGLDVKALWMHQPWTHSAALAESKQMGNIGKGVIREALRKSLEDAVTLDALAKRKGIPVTEPFSGLGFDNNTLVVLGPTEASYRALVAEFRASPGATSTNSLFKTLALGAVSLAQRLQEAWNIETLVDDGDGTSAENNSSVITLFQLDGKSMLLTGDAGIPALTVAADELDRLGHDREAFSLVQVPHHGSRRNVGPTILNRLLGTPKQCHPTTRTAIASVAKDCAPKHPAKKVTNAFRRRGAPVYQTAGSHIHHNSGMPLRDGWQPVTALPHFDEVDE